jgi:hypothetical protein
MSKDTILQWIFIKGACIVMLTIMSAAIYFSLQSMDDLRSLYLHGNIIIYRTKVVASASGVPIYIYFIFTALRVLISKGTTIPTKRTFIGTVWGALSAVTTVTGMIIAFLVPIGLIFSPYSNCHEEKLGSYYVTDLKLCETIITNTHITKIPD